MKEVIDFKTIESKYNGPPGSGNGGYVAGLLAAYHDASSVRVRLRKPPPLETQMSIVRDGDKVWLEYQGEIVAESVASSLDMEVPCIPSYAIAEAASQSYPGFERHAFPYCYVCGPKRKESDGLRLFTGLASAGDYVAAPFHTFDELYNANGQMTIETIYAALDCPGAYAITQIDEEKVLVLGEIVVDIIEPIRKGDKLIVMGWYLGKERKKNFSGTAIINQAGDIKAKAKATWIEIDPLTFNKN